MVTIAPFGLYTLALRRLPSSEASIVATLEPAVAVMLASFVLGERLGEVSEVGATTVLVDTSLGTALEISFTDVESADGGRIELSVSGEELMADRETAS